MNKFILGEVCKKIGSGATPRGGSDVYLSQGKIALIRSQNIYNDGFKRDGLAYITSEHAEELNNVEIEPDDILLNITGDSVARCCQVPNELIPARVNQHVAIIRPNEDKLDPRYLRYYLIDPVFQDYMLMLASGGATRNALTKGMIESFEIFAPSLSEQRTIAGILGNLDNKIEVNRRMNATLESMAQAVFRQWFVENEEVTSWEAGKIKDVCEKIENGGTPRRDKPEYWEPGTIPWLTSGEVRQEIIISTENKISVDGYKNSSAKMWSKGTTVVALYGATAGEVSFVANELCANQACCGLTPKADWQYFAYLTLSASENSLASQARGSAQQNLSQQIVADFPIRKPEQKLLNGFNQIVAPLFDKWIANLNESRTLASLRDSLLPKLMKGEIRLYRK